MSAPANLKVENYGAVAQLSIPNGWVEDHVAKRSEFDLAELKKFTPSGKSDVQLVFHYRGQPISEQQAANFTAVLSQPPRLLRKEEWWSVQEVLNRMAIPDEFSLLTVRTELLNQKCVMTAEGRWKDSSIDMYCVFVDVEGDGSIVQEIYFAAGKSDYYKHLTEFKRAIASVEWKPAEAGDSAYNDLVEL